MSEPEPKEETITTDSVAKLMFTTFYEAKNSWYSWDQLTDEDKKPWLISANAAIELLVPEDQRTEE